MTKVGVVSNGLPAGPVALEEMIEEEVIDDEQLEVKQTEIKISHKRVESKSDVDNILHQSKEESGFVVERSQLRTVMSEDA